MEIVFFGTRARCALASAGLVTGLMGVAIPASAAVSSAASPSLQAIDQALANVHVGSPNRLIHENTPGISGLNQLTSSNWSGYVDDNSHGNTYKKLSGQWVQPAVTCIRNNDEELAVFWVGLDGFNDSTVEQDGTGALCDNGAIEYFDWWEMFPTKPSRRCAVISPGDSITSSVKFSSGAYTLKVADATHTSASFSTTQTCSGTCSNASAEWIAERPSGSSGLAVLPNFGTWKVGQASVKSGSTLGVISTFPDDALTMENASNQVLVSVGALNSTHNGFKAVWHQSA